VRLTCGARDARQVFHRTRSGASAAEDGQV
jgi:hypothetical protein